VGSGLHTEWLGPADAAVVGPEHDLVDEDAQGWVNSHCSLIRTAVQQSFFASEFVVPN